MNLEARKKISYYTRTRALGLFLRLIFPVAETKPEVLDGCCFGVEAMAAAQAGGGVAAVQSARKKLRDWRQGPSNERFDVFFRGRAMERACCLDVTGKPFCKIDFFFGVWVGSGVLYTSTPGELLVTFRSAE